MCTYGEIDDRMLAKKDYGEKAVLSFRPSFFSAAVKEKRIEKKCEL